MSYNFRDDVITGFIDSLPIMKVDVLDLTDRVIFQRIIKWRAHQ